MKKIHINNDNNWATPPYFYRKLDERFNFDFDPCPYNEGELKFDGLEIEWGNRNFVNPPYSRKLKELFVKKGIEEANKGKLCVFFTSCIHVNSFVSRLHSPKCFRNNVGERKAKVWKDR